MRFSRRVRRLTYLGVSAWLLLPATLTPADVQSAGDFELTGTATAGLRDLPSTGDDFHLVGRAVRGTGLRFVGADFVLSSPAHAGLDPCACLCGSELIFSDCFESGNTNNWSSTVGRDQISDLHTWKER